MLRLIDKLLISEYKYLNDVEFETDYEALGVMRAHRINNIIIKSVMFIVPYILVLYCTIKSDVFAPLWLLLIVGLVIRRYDYVTSNFN